jgi:hypothetical protein
MGARSRLKYLAALAVCECVCRSGLDVDRYKGTRVIAFQGARNPAYEWSLEHE